ncbi:indoleamine 2,3-dioxygenase [Klebsormidium nitens]|uniref:Indoleamine 2,3-dioxygenase n=1 Tax=Klebsormidium nitens TaxID=105231 RepID=A0A1Y1HVD0_KLENI|nr:indoleamine 2,3-dioxygenase [Klebsormidium nitens]|eukprot:GAQ82575.1 indoleamine 2,3-dioxygenase [Klebsormidium nitens]
MAIKEVKPAVSGDPIKHHQPQSAVQQSEISLPPAAADGVFKVTGQNGFLPLVPALRQLPSGRYDLLETIMQRIPIALKEAAPDALKKEVLAIPESVAEDWRAAIEVEEDTQLAQAVYRDLSILTAAYITEGRQKENHSRALVPAVLARPFYAAAKRVDQQLIMEYSSYCLNNFYSVDGSEGDWTKLRLIRSFDGGPEEATFILIHSIIEHNTPRMIEVIERVKEAVKAADVAACEEGLKELLKVQERLLVCGLQMFNASDPECYVDKVRPWIFGYKNNPDFPDGVVFDGVLDNQPQFLRGETGAQSNIIPVLDALLGIEHAHDALFQMLKELEDYRPAGHRRYLQDMRRAMWGDDVSEPRADVTRAHALRALVEERGSRELAATFNECVMAVYLFRAMHVIYSDLYIGRKTAKEAATGGTPYKVYLRKHRDESIRQQIQKFPDAVFSSPLPSAEEVAASLDACRSGASENGIPSILRAIPPFSRMIAEHGRGHPSLKTKMYPSKEWALSATDMPCV